MSFKKQNKYFIKCNIAVVLAAGWMGWEMLAGIH